MSNDAVIQVEGLGKKYVIGHESQRTRDGTLRDAIVRVGKGFTRTLKQTAGGRPLVAGDTTEEFWALKDVSFEVKRGEVLGIIGRNGAGKSTLLKILSRITDPSEGRVILHGRVASLLEVGTGFHLELTGRENVYLNGAILGMTRAEISRKFDEIVAFSGVEWFIDTPVKRYSSGMYMRLAFAVAAHLHPEILVIDEILAVGDIEFQNRCLGKMSEVASHGQTILFVSHNMNAISQLCKRALVMDGGRLDLVAPVEMAISRHLGIEEVASAHPGWNWDGQSAPGNDELRLCSVKLHGDQSLSRVFRPDEAITIVVRLEHLRPLPGLRLVLSILTTTGEVAFVSTDQQSRGEHAGLPGLYESRCTIPGGLLNRRHYILRLQATIRGQVMILEPVDVGSFAIEGVSGNEGALWATTWPGVVCPRLGWSFEKLTN
jgi:lipopolysaccharide transport system ATP-binding protein